MEIMRTEIGKALYPHAFKKHVNTFNRADEKKQKYECQIVLTKEQIAPIVARMKEVAKEKYGETWEKQFGCTFLNDPKNDKSKMVCLGYSKGDTKGFPGMYLLKASSDKKPTVVNVNNEEILTEGDANLFNGQNIRLGINFYTSGAGFQKGIYCGLQAVKVIGGGTPTDPKANAQEVFGDDDEPEYGEDATGTDEFESM